MKKELENAPPEPREPAAREAVEAEAMKFIIERGWEDNNYGVSRVAAEFALAYSAELRAEIRDICEALNLPVQANEIDVRNIARAKAKEAVTNAEKYFNLYAASERSLLQARAELIPAVQLLLEWMPKYSIGSSGYLRQERVMKALLASTSAPEGGAAK